MINQIKEKRLTFESNEEVYHKTKKRQKKKEEIPEQKVR